MLRWFLLLAVPLLGQPERSFTYYLSGSAADAQTTTKPGFLLAGGGKDNPAAFRWLLERSGGGDLVVLRASGADGYHLFAAELVGLDSVETIVFHSRAAAQDAFVLERIRHADAIFLAGGDQWNYYGYWRDTPVARAVNAAIARGIPVGGTSAGLAVLGEYGFTAEHDTVTSAVALADPFHAKVGVAGEFFRIPALACTITDSHFSQRDRLGRLVVFMARIHTEQRCAQVQGLGVDERTALLLEPDGRGLVVGEGAVHWLRLKTAELKQGQPAQIARLEAAALAAGRTLDLSGPLPGGYGLTVEAGRLMKSVKP